MLKKIIEDLSKWIAIPYSWRRNFFKRCHCTNMCIITYSYYMFSSVAQKKKNTPGLLKFKESAKSPKYWDTSHGDNGGTLLVRQQYIIEQCELRHRSVCSGRDKSRTENLETVLYFVSCKPGTGLLGVKIHPSKTY